MRVPGRDGCGIEILIGGAEAFSRPQSGQQRLNDGSLDGLPEEEPVPKHLSAASQPQLRAGGSLEDVRSHLAVFRL